MGDRNEKLAAWFVWADRDDLTRFVTLKDDAPGWLRDAVSEAHSGDMPDDWIYAECEAACRAIDDGRLTPDSLHEYADGRVDVYTRDLFRWAADMCLTSTWAGAEEAAEGLCGSAESTTQRIMAIQYEAIRNIASCVLYAAERAAEESADETGEG